MQKEDIKLLLTERTLSGHPFIVVVTSPNGQGFYYGKCTFNHRMAHKKWYINGDNTTISVKVNRALQGGKYNGPAPFAHHLSTEELIKHAMYVFTTKRDLCAYLRLHKKEYKLPEYIMHTLDNNIAPKWLPYE